MRLQIVISLVVFSCVNSTFAQKGWTHKKKYSTQKNAVYFYWGYNRSMYTPSNTTFYGPDYYFTARHLRAKDRPSTDIRIYVKPTTASIPQFNVRLGWYYKDGWDISGGYDHMKYVMRPGQTLVLQGYINGTTGSLNGTFSESDGEIPIIEDELHYENTNGLNYITVQLNNSKPIIKSANSNFALLRRLGGGFGPVVTQTDFFWDYQQYHSKLKMAGYGASLNGGLRMDFWRRFFVQTSITTGFIHLPKNPTIQHEDHYAKQAFVFLEWDVVAGFFVFLKNSKKCDSCPDW